jgi:hypothetical protein
LKSYHILISIDGGFGDDHDDDDGDGEDDVVLSLILFRLLLQRLMKMCGAILTYTDFNLMTIQNLAIVLGPNMLYDRNTEGEDNMV